jgi:hypothetical protein
MLALLLAADGCSAPPAKTPPGEAPAASLVWPRPPAPPRMRYLRSVAGAQDWGIGKSGLRRLLDAITGQTEAHFVRPTGVAERRDVLFVADPGAQALFILDAGRHRLLMVNRLGEEALVSPVAVALGPADTVFLVDSWLKKVFAVDAEGRLQRVVVDRGLARPAAVAYDAARERLYLADSMAHQIVVYAADGRRLNAFGANGRRDGEFNSPTHLALAADGSLLVTDALNFRVQVFDPAGKFLRKMGQPGDGAGDFAAPKGVAADRFGHIYVADALFNAVQIFDRDGALLLGVGELGTRAGQFSLPGGLFMGPSDRLYVADSYNQRIQVFQYLPAPEDDR